MPTKSTFAEAAELPWTLIVGVAPYTCNKAPGAVVPIPTLPLVSTLTFSASFITNISG